jgi:membrane associated rhomboid family serine protease
MMSPAPFTRAVIIANVAVAVVSATCWALGWPDLLREWMPLSLQGMLEGKWWQVFTYMWIHAQIFGAGALHILFNMMTLAPFGRMVESVLGARRFAVVYFSGGLAGAAAFLLEMVVRQEGAESLDRLGFSMVGASAAVLAVVTVFACMHPSAPLMLFFIPVKVRAIRMVQGFAVLSLVLLWVPGLDFVAHGAHLGGMLAGWWCARRYLRSPPPRAWAPHLAPDIAPPQPLEEEIHVEDLSPEALQVELDRVLEKISRQGLGSLGARDWHILRLARERL